METLTKLNEVRYSEFDCTQQTGIILTQIPSAESWHTSGEYRGWYKGTEVMVSK
jgi:hypothetical protein